MAVFPAGPGVRVDTHIEAGTRVPPFYDSLLAKVITHGATRGDALKTMAMALANCRIAGVANNVALLSGIIADVDFARGGVDTMWLAGWISRLEAHAAQT
jgi:acetyl-CoA carboxylase biotin carboxylase subunit